MTKLGGVGYVGWMLRVPFSLRWLVFFYFFSFFFFLSLGLVSHTPKLSGHWVHPMYTPLHILCIK